MCVFSSDSPLLSWRDIQHIIVKTSRAGHLSAPDWKTNAAGYNGTHTLTQIDIINLSIHCLNTSIKQLLRLRFIVGCSVLCIKKNTKQLQREINMQYFDSWISFLQSEEGWWAVSKNVSFLLNYCANSCHLSGSVLWLLFVTVFKCVCAYLRVCVWRRETNTVRSRGQPGCRPMCAWRFSKWLFFPKRN